MSTIFVLLGLSNSGKDTAAGFMLADNIKFSAMMKRTLEKWYGLNEGDLDNKFVRSQIVPGESFTYLDVMVRAYHAWQAIDDKLTVRPTTKQIRQSLEAGRDVVLTDIRKEVEVEAVRELSKEGHNVVLVHIFGRQGEQRLSSDAKLEELFEELRHFANDVIGLQNNGDIDHLVDEMMFHGLIPRFSLTT